MTKDQIAAEHAKREALEELLRKLGVPVENPGCGSAVLTEQLVRAFRAPSEVELAAREWAVWERALRHQADAREAWKTISPEERRRASVMADYTEQRLLEVCERRAAPADRAVRIVEHVLSTLAREG